MQAPATQFTLALQEPMPKNNSHAPVRTLLKRMGEYGAETSVRQTVELLQLMLRVPHMDPPPARPPAVCAKCALRQVSVICPLLCHVLHLLQHPVVTNGVSQLLGPVLPISRNQSKVGTLAMVAGVSGAAAASKASHCGVLEAAVGAGGNPTSLGAWWVMGGCWVGQGIFRWFKGKHPTSGSAGD